jgi:hypothetical protein
MPITKPPIVAWVCERHVSGRRLINQLSFDVISQPDRIPRGRYWFSRRTHRRGDNWALPTRKALPPFG